MAGTRKCVVLALPVLLVLTNGVHSANVQCLSASGKPTDWFIVYKLPDNEENVATDAFFYLDAERSSWQLSDKTMDQTGHAVYYTMSQIYNTSLHQGEGGKTTDLLYLMYNDQEKPGLGWGRTSEHGHTKGEGGMTTDLLYLMYNDQEKPGLGWGRTSEHGHTKGVVAFDETSGFWLVHSTPHFPPPRDTGYAWPSSARIYGQTFLCVSMDTRANLDIIGRQLLYNYPHVYDFASSAYFSKNFPNMAAVLKNSHVTRAPWSSEEKLTSLAGTTFHSFAKFSKFDADLYAEWLAPRFGNTLYVETWQNGRNKLCSNCTGKFKVYNVATVSFKSEAVTFTETKDHSKWAVTLTSSKPWTCIGDINRQESQLTRPGGTVCFQNPAVWNSFSKLILDYHNCDPYGNCVKKLCRSCLELSQLRPIRKLR